MSFANCSGRFIPAFSTVAKSLYDLCKKDAKFVFGERKNGVFSKLKELFSTNLILTIYSPYLDTGLHCDASSVGSKAILMQKKKADGLFELVSYFSRRTTPAESQYHSFELECLAVVYEIKRSHIYLYGKEFKVITDCDSFRLTLSKQTNNPRV